MKINEYETLKNASILVRNGMHYETTVDFDAEFILVSNSGEKFHYYEAALDNVISLHEIILTRQNMMSCDEIVLLLNDYWNLLKMTEGYKQGFITPELNSSYLKEIIEKIGRALALRYTSDEFKFDIKKYSEFRLSFKYRDEIASKIIKSDYTIFLPDGIIYFMGEFYYLKF